MLMHIYWKYKLQPASTVQGDRNKWDLLARVVGAQISSYWAHGQLEVPEIKWVRTPFGTLPPQPISQTLLPIFRGSGSKTNPLLYTLTTTANIPGPAPS